MWIALWLRLYGSPVGFLPVFHHSADNTYIFFYFFWDHLAYSGYFENRVPLKQVLGQVYGGYCKCAVVSFLCLFLVSSFFLVSRRLCL